MRGLARASLLLALTMEIAGSGCLVTSSPDFAEPKMTRPYLTAESPSVTWAVMPVKSVGPGPAFGTEWVYFSVVSEDLNQTLKAALVLDYEGPVTSGTERPISFPGKEIAPGHLDAANVAAPRQVSMDFRLDTGTRAGCHTITAIVSHDFAPNSIDPTSQDDTGTLTWWLDVQDPLGGTTPPQSLSMCFAGPTTGVDAGIIGASP